MLTQFFRSRPARYPPIAEAMICETISHAIAAMPIAEADAAALDHGETEERPIPVPRASRISDIAAPTTAPPITAAHDIPDEDASFFAVGSAKPNCWGCVSGAVAGCAIKISSLI